MARIRSIKPEFWQDEKLAPLDPMTRLVFLGLVSMADDAGRVLDNVKIIDAFIFPETEESCRGAVATLAELGRIKRGVTASGQRVIQVVNWRHQRIDRPNFAGALPQIEGDTPQLPLGAASDQSTNNSTKRRGKLSKRVVEAVWSASKGSCQRCGVECTRRKRDKYDNNAALGEVAHIVALADGGDNSLSNLQLLCLACNRAKGGVAASTRNRGRAVDDSTKDTGTISTIYDQRSTTNDQRSTIDEQRSPATAATTTTATSDIRGWQAFEADVPHALREDVAAALRASSQPDALRRQLVAMREAIGGGQAFSVPVIAQAIQELAVAGSRITASGLRAFCARIARERAAPIPKRSPEELYADA
jgi:hypothetical protein